MTENDYNWFIGQLNDTKAIEEIRLELSIHFNTKSGKENYNDQFNKISAAIDFRQPRIDHLNYSDVNIEVQTTNQEQEAHNIYSTIMNMLEDNQDRYNKTIRNRKMRIQSFCISVGIILSYILYAVLKINSDKIPGEMAQYLSNKNVIVFGQWFVSILLGNVFSYW